MDPAGWPGRCPQALGIVVPHPPPDDVRGRGRYAMVGRATRRHRTPPPRRGAR
ncbi:hypothetical protein V2I01_27570 [Micromonospora sp. BRA006-A]|nr:hypothetical protein [Micromonospora sp. BRA006-A]